MAILKSQRALKLLGFPKYFNHQRTDGMRQYPGQNFKLWVELEWEMDNVKKLSFHGDLNDWEKVLLESMASLMSGRPITRLDQLSLRECEAFLRDRNSELALEDIPADAEENFQKVFTWIRLWPRGNSSQEYVFPSDKGPFRNLKLADKVRELKGFLNSPEVLGLYQDRARPELVDLDGLTVYVEVPYENERERALFDELHALGVEAFQEEQLNFIPEA